MELASLHKLLQIGIFVIPEYQRGYSWSNKQLNEFIEDLEDVKHVKEHYTGTITLIESGDEKIGFKQHKTYDVVDGQQRLTTIHILLASLYYRCKTEGIEAQEVIQYVLHNGTSLLRLNSPENDKFFQFLLHKESVEKVNESELQNKTQLNLYNARRTFDKYFDRTFGPRKTPELFNNLINKFKVNIFELSTESEVGLIFETMNDRGLPLSDIDKVKNYLVYVCHRLDNDRLAQDTNRKFGKIFNDLMKVDSKNSLLKIENQFLKISYLIYSGDTKELNDIHRKIKTRLIPKKVLLRERDLFVNDQTEKKSKEDDVKRLNSFLVKAAKEYVKIINHCFENESIDLGLYRLKILGKLDVLSPLLLSMAISSKMTDNFLSDIIGLLEIYCLRVFTFGGKKSNTGIGTFNDLAYGVQQNEITYTQLKRAIKELTSQFSNTREFKKTISTEMTYGKVDSDALKYFLYEFEKSKSKKFALENLQEFMSVNTYTIEHIYPQVPLPGDRGLDNTHYLGNLVLTNKNSVLSNQDFIGKKKVFADSELATERELCNYDNWTDRTIIDRGKEMSKFAQDRWKN